MIELPFLHDFFYTDIPSNKDELLHEIENSELDKNQNFSWNTFCSLKLERLDLDKKIELLQPSLSKFLQELNIESDHMNVQLCGLWRNTYYQHSFQEIHDHSPHHFSGVLFLTDEQPGDSKFYFVNKHLSEIPQGWRTLRKGESIVHAGRYWLKAERGRIVLFPSYLMHGVTEHHSETPRQTVSFNFDFL